MHVTESCPFHSSAPQMCPISPLPPPPPDLSSGLIPWVGCRFPLLDECSSEVPQPVPALKAKSRVFPFPACSPPTSTHTACPLSPPVGLHWCPPHAGHHSGPVADQSKAESTFSAVTDVHSSETHGEENRKSQAER